MKLKFSGHQTFTLRHGWIEKGYEYAKKHQDFNSDKAIVDLGVGKNMVPSIKYWCETMQIIDSDGETTRFGDFLLDRKTGVDPFLEDPNTWWLLQWKMLTNQQQTTSAQQIFYKTRGSTFTKENIFDITVELAQQHGKKLSKNVINRDIDCYVKTYTRSSKKKDKDDPLGCPLQELNLIQKAEDADTYQIIFDTKNFIPPQIIGYAIVEYCNMQENPMISTSVQNLVYDFKSPGKTFAIDENTILNAVEELSANKKWGDMFAISESSGITQVYCKVDKNSAQTLLKDYYLG